MELGVRVEAEIQDIDPTVTREDVLEAIRNAVSEDAQDKSEEFAITEVMGLWILGSSCQMVTVKMSRWTFSKVRKVRIGWSVSRVRERAKPLVRSYRYHGFGHTSLICRDPDYTGACRRCGDSGHKEKACTNQQVICVSCSVLPTTAASHQQGSGSCAARRAPEMERWKKKQLS